MTEKPSLSGIHALLTTREVDKELNDMAQRVIGARQPPIDNLPPSRQGAENAKKDGLCSLYFGLCSLMTLETEK